MPEIDYRSVVHAYLAVSDYCNRHCHDLSWDDFNQLQDAALVLRRLKRSFEKEVSLALDDLACLKHPDLTWFGRPATPEEDTAIADLI